MKNKFFTYALLLIITGIAHASAPSSEATANPSSTLAADDNQSSLTSKTNEPFTLIAIHTIRQVLQLDIDARNKEELAYNDNGKNVEKEILQAIDSVINDRYKIADAIYKLNPTASTGRIGTAVEVEMKIRLLQSHNNIIEKYNPLTKKSFITEQASQLKTLWDCNFFVKDRLSVEEIIEQDCETYKNGPKNDGKCLTQ